MIPAVATLLPHVPPMRLLEAVTRFEGAQIDCTAVLEPSCPFADGVGGVDPMVTIELVAQAAAAWAALTGGGEVRPGMVASCRDATFHAVPLRLGDALVIRAERTAGTTDFGSFAGSVERAGTCVATITVGVVLGASAS